LREIDAIARRYGVVPSDLVNMSLQDYNLNMLISSVAYEKEQKDYNDFKKEQEKKIRAMRKR